MGVEMLKSGINRCFIGTFLSTCYLWKTCGKWKSLSGAPNLMLFLIHPHPFWSSRVEKWKTYFQLLQLKELSSPRVSSACGNPRLDRRVKEPLTVANTIN